MIHIAYDHYIGMSISVIDYNPKKHVYYSACLTVTTDSANQIGKVIFVPCKPEQVWEWQIQKINLAGKGTTEEFFVLHHVYTQTCLGSSNIRHELNASSCDNLHKDSQITLLWKLHLQNGSLVSHEKFHLVVDQRQSYIFLTCTTLALIVLISKCVLMIRKR